jgi:hopene-associated glycosyltransferase HpnB
MSVGFFTALAALAAWLYLTGWRGGFWRASVRQEHKPPPDPLAWPGVVAVVPARDEADVIATTLPSLMAQDYPGAFEVILVDDQSRDGTAALARQAVTAPDRLTIISGQGPPPGWGGKVWAMQQGLAYLQGRRQPPRYVLFTDADIVFDPAALRQLVARAEAGGLVLTSLMVKLACASLAERLFIPAFIFFFQMLYPFAWVNRARHRIAAAAGGCMLVRFSALITVGGLETIRTALIDDCALGRRMKAVGPIWLGLTDRVHSLRAYLHVQDIRRMVARSAYDQLKYSRLLLAATIAGLALTDLAPPLITLFGTGAAQAIAAAASLLMIVAYQPTLRFYRLSPLWALALPAVALAYMAFTLDSAYQHRRGRGGLWKGRVHANVSGLR